MTDETTIDAEIRAIREEYADEEAEAAENAATLEVPLSLRITKEMDRQLRQRAAAEQIPTSTLVRRLLGQAVRDRGAPVLTVEQVEEIALRMAREVASSR